MRRRSWALKDDEAAADEYLRALADFRAQQSDEDQLRDQAALQAELMRRDTAERVYKVGEALARRQAEAAAHRQHHKRRFGAAVLRFFGLKGRGRI